MRNLFQTKTVVFAWLFSFLIPLLIETQGNLEKIVFSDSNTERFLALNGLIGSVAIAWSRYQAKGIVYTPDFLPGRNKRS